MICFARFLFSEIFWYTCFCRYSLVEVYLTGRFLGGNFLAENFWYSGELIVRVSLVEISPQIALGRTFLFRIFLGSFFLEEIFGRDIS